MLDALNAVNPFKQSAAQCGASTLPRRSHLFTQLEEEVLAICHIVRWHVALAVSKKDKGKATHASTPKDRHYFWPLARLSHSGTACR